MAWTEITRSKYERKADKYHMNGTVKGHKKFSTLINKGNFYSLAASLLRNFPVITKHIAKFRAFRMRGGSVGLNSICQVVKWISALFMPLPGLAAAV